MIDWGHAGRLQYLWRAVDQDGEVLDILVRSQRNKSAVAIRPTADLPERCGVALGVGLAAGVGFRQLRLMMLPRRANNLLRCRGAAPDGGRGTTGVLPPRPERTID
jgi:hypothetical protein